MLLGVRGLVTTCLALAIVAAPTSARAEDADGDSYGGWIIASEAASAAAFGVGVYMFQDDHDGTPSGDIVLAGMAGLALSGPIVHAAHGNWSGAGKSLGLRVGAGVVVGAIAARGCPDREPGEDDGCGATRAAVAGVIAAASVTVVDVLWLARKPTSSPERRPAMTVVPTDGGAVFGITGAF